MDVARVVAWSPGVTLDKKVPERSLTPAMCQARVRGSMVDTARGAPSQTGEQTKVALWALWGQNRVAFVHHLGT